MTKEEAIETIKENGGYSATHPVTDGYIWRRTVTEPGKASYDKVEFEGDCSPKDGWELDYLYAR